MEWDGRRRHEEPSTREEEAPCYGRAGQGRAWSNAAPPTVEPEDR